jgi:NADH dehydrogenase (ubiquinone) 1 alpha subcomplex subunit 10
MFYIGDATLDDHYINSYGFDLRSLNSEMPESCRSFDIHEFHKNPKHLKVATMQLLMYRMRYFRYVDALAHMLSTGQGVVIERSCYSDFAFVEAMYQNKYLSKEGENNAALDLIKSCILSHIDGFLFSAYETYNETKNVTVTQLLRPHLIIYLDVPVSTTLDNIKKNGKLGEKDSPVYTEKYLSIMENSLKNKYLKEMR